MHTNKISFIELEISNQCNAACPGCARTHIEQGLYPGSIEKKHLSLTDIKTIFSDPLFYPRGVKLCGNLGDPLMNPECYEICEFLLDRGIRVKVNTNGGIGSEAFWNKMGKLGEKHKPRLKLVFAVDGLEDSNHIYRENVKWSVVMRSIKTYMQYNTYGEWHFIPFEHCEHQVEEAKALSHELGLNFVLRKSLRNYKGWQNQKQKEIKAGSSNEHKNISIFLDKLTSIRSYENSVRAGKELDDTLKTRLKLLGQSVHCICTDDKHLFIDPQGRLWPCCMLYDTFVKAEDIIFLKSLPKEEHWNSLLHHSFKDILNSGFYTKLSERWDIDNPKFTSRCLRDCGNDGKFSASFDRFTKPFDV